MGLKPAAIKLQLVSLALNNVLSSLMERFSYVFIFVNDMPAALPDW